MLYATLSRGVWGIVGTFFSFYNEIFFGCHGLSLTGRGGGCSPVPLPDNNNYTVREIKEIIVFVKLGSHKCSN